ncbi:MAG: VUT family protein [Bacilli bacterium]|nr:VUT family protein [Bacilli bacterium]
MKDTRKILFVSLLTALLIFSNIVAIKMTVVAKLPLPCSIFIYPFTFLCVAVISDLYGTQTAIKSVCFAVLAQVLLTIVGTIIVNLDNQVSTLVEANALQQILAPIEQNGIYMPNVKVLFASILGFSVSQLVNIGIYTFVKNLTFRPIACALSILIAIMIDTIIYVPISTIGTADVNLTLTILNKFVVGVIITFISVVLFSIFTIGKKEPEKKVKAKA